MENVTYRQLADEILARYPGRVMPERMDDAIEIAAQPGMIRRDEAPGTFRVRSGRMANTWYIVDTRARTCTCKYSQLAHKVCKHRAAVWLLNEQKIRAIQIAGLADREAVIKQLGF